MRRLSQTVQRVWILQLLLLFSATIVSAAQPVSVWRGEGNAQDSSGGNHGVIVGGVTYAPGVHGQAFKLDGSGGYIRIQDHPSLRFTNELSVEMWFKRDDASSYGTLIDKRSWSQCNYGIIMAPDWRFQVYYDDPDYQNYSGWYEISFSAVPSAGVFHHVVGTFRQIDSGHVQIKTYMDGHLVDTAQWEGRLANTLNNNPLAIGSARDGSCCFFKGLIDEVALYDRALTPLEVHANYVEFAPTNSVPTTNEPPATNSVPYANALGQVALWSGNSNALDSVGSNHGTLMNGASFAPGVSGPGFFLSNGDDYVRVLDSASLHLTNELSLSMWFKRADENSYGVLFDKRNWDTCNYGVIMSADWAFSVYYDDPTESNPTSQYENSFSDVPSAGVFHYLVGTYRQADASHVEVKTFIDGQLVQADLLPGSLAQTINNDPLAIGSARDGSCCSFQGVIDEVALYNRALPASEVLSNYLAIVPDGTNTPPPATNSGPIVALWHADGDALDSVGGQHGQLRNGAAFAPGISGQGWLLNGQSAYVRIPDQRTLHLSNALTLEMWFKRADDSSYGALFDKRNWANCNFGTIMSHYWGFQLYYDDPSVADGNKFEISFSSVPAAGVFHHFAGTFSQVDAGHVELNTYIDGQLVRSDILRGNLSTTFNGQALAIGAVEDGNGAFFHGVIDEVAIYNYALSSTEVVSNYVRFSGTPQIVTQPASVNLVAGASAGFAVVAIGSSPLRYQWQFNGDAIAGATSSTLAIASVQSANAGGYTVIVSNGFGVVTSAVATLTISADGVAPSFTRAPLSHYSGFVGDDVTLSASAAGTPVLRYQWSFNGVDIPDATNATLRLSNIQLANAGLYRLLVTNDFGFVLSGGSSLHVSSNISGGMIHFANSSTNLVLGTDGATPVPPGSGFVAALFLGTNGAPLVNIGSPASFVFPGRFFGGLRIVPWLPAGTPVAAQVRVWDSSVSAEYDEAVALGARFGTSQVFQVTLSGGITPPPGLEGMSSFSLQAGVANAPQRVASRALQPPRIGSFRTGDDGVEFVITGNPGATYAIETSEDCAQWTPLTFVVNDSGALRVTDDSPAAQKRFYRARLVTP